MVLQIYDWRNGEDVKPAFPVSSKSDIFVPTQIFAGSEYIKTMEVALTLRNFSFYTSSETIYLQGTVQVKKPIEGHQNRQTSNKKEVFRCF